MPSPVLIIVLSRPGCGEPREEADEYVTGGPCPGDMAGPGCSARGGGRGEVPVKTGAGQAPAHHVVKYSDEVAGWGAGKIEPSGPPRGAEIAFPLYVETLHCVEVKTSSSTN